MRALNTFILFTFILSLALIMPAASHARATEPGEMVLEVSNEVLSMVRGLREDENGSEKLQEKLQNYLSTYIDFPAFARGVMGKYREDASEEKKEKFTSDFKRTLVKLYSKAMLAFEVRDVSIAEVINPRPDVAQVTMHITSKENASFKAQYSLRKGPDGKWQVRNVVLDGVNLGLTYRNQFYSAVSSNDGDVTAAINNWSDVMKDTQKDIEKDIDKKK